MELLSSNRDLAALSMLSTTWRDRDPTGIADDLATVLAPIVNPEFIATTSLGGGREGYRLAWMQSAAWARSNVIDALRALVPGHMADSSVSGMAKIANPADQRILPRPLCTHVDWRQCAARYWICRSRISHSITADTHRFERQSAVDLDSTVACGNRGTSVLVGNSKDFMGIASADGTPQYVNPAGRQLVGLDDVEQCRQHNILDFLPERNRISVRDECCRDGNGPLVR